MTLTAAKAALLEGKPDEALGHLLAAWRACHDLALAEAIERVSAMVKRPELLGTAKKRHEDFLTLAAKGDPADIDRLYASLGEGQTSHFIDALDVLEKLPADPRFTTRALQLIQKPRVTSSSSFPGWRRLFNQLTNNEDLRALPLLKALDFTDILGAEHAYSAGFFSERAQKTIAALEALTPQRLGNDDAKLVQELLSRREAATRDVSGLEAAVYASPDDVTPRQVLADVLLEQGDARGEFITLQLAALKGRLPAAQRWREYDLLEAHRDAWLGPLKLALDKWRQLASFVGGFLHTFSLTDKPHAMKVISETPAFSTVKTLLLSLSDETPLPIGLLREPALARITGLGGISERAFREVFTAKEPWPYEELITNEPGFENIERDVRVLCDSSAVPKLRRLKVSGYAAKPEQFAPLWSSSVGAQLDGFGARMGLYSLGAWVAHIEQHKLDAQLRSFDLGFNFGAHDFGAVLSRGADGTLSDLEVWKCPPDSAHGTPKISKLAERLDAIPPDRLTAFRYLGKLSKPDRKRLDTSLARQTRLKVADLR